MKKNVIILAIEVLLFYVLLNSINDSEIFNLTFLFINFSISFVIGMQDKKYKYLYPLLLGILLIFNTSTYNHLLFMNYFVFSYLGIFISTFINGYSKRRHLRYIHKLVLTCITTFILIVLLSMNFYI